KLLPEHDVRSGAWHQMALGGGTGGSMSDSGQFEIGVGASYGGQHTTLSHAAASGATEIIVDTPAVFTHNAMIAAGGFPSPDTKKITKVDAAHKKYTLDTALSKDYPKGAPIGSGRTSGQSTTVAQAAAAGATELFVADAAPFSAGVAIALGPAPSPDI